MMLVAWVARVEAGPTYDNCYSCHTGFRNTGPLHQDHLTKFGITSCTACHQQSGGQLPVLTYWSADGFGCSGCHGVDYGQTSVNSGEAKSTSYGLRQVHAAAGVTTCPNCHFPGSPTTGEPDPAPAIQPETALPPYYGQPTNNLTDPCSSTQEDFSGDGTGLDNDGNGFRDMADPACATASTTTSTTPTTSTTSTTLPIVGPKRITVYPGDSIQAAVDAAAPGAIIRVMPGTYVETHGGLNAVTINKDGIRLIARSKPNQGLRVILQPHPGQRNGIVVEPAVANTRIDGVKIKGFTVQGFPNNGIVTRYVDDFKIERNESIDNLENGIWPTLSANGTVRRNVAYGSQDSALWVEASENVRVLNNELYNSPTGLEVTVSNNILVKGNDVHDNTVGIGLYHPEAAGLPPLQPLDRNADWTIVNNYVHDNNAPNNAPPGGLVEQLPPGGGILVLGVDRVSVERNRIENNNFYGIAVVDWCLAVLGTPFDCSTHPPDVTDTAPDDNIYVSNQLTNNGTDPVPFGGLEIFAADITYLVLGSHSNCFAKNTYSTIKYLVAPELADSCG